MNLFSESPKNVRNERRDILDVKMRSEPVRNSRRSRVLFGLLAAAAFLVALSLGWQGWKWVHRWVLGDSRAFALNTIEVQTEGWLTADQLVQWAGVRLGDNLLTVDLARIRRDLELIPQIESVSVERILPHLLRLRVTEREAVARVHAIQPDGNGDYAPVAFLLDASGMVMPPLPVAAQSAAVASGLEYLPLFRGVSSSDLRPGQSLSLPGVVPALRLVGEFDKSPMAGRAELRSIDLSLTEVLQVTTTQGAQAVLGYDRLAQQLQRWRLIQEAGQRMGRAIASIDLSVSNNVPVLWLAAAAEPPLKPKPAKPNRPRKKNV